MQQSLVRCAVDEYARGNYLSSLDIFRQLSNKLGEENFRANIWLCQKRLAQLGRRDCTALPLKAIKVACVMDEFTFHSYEPECNLLQLTPDAAVSELEVFNPDLLFIESAWRGKDELWNRKIGTLSSELKSVLQWCKERHVPTIFWNKEDPVHFETFLTTAQQFDYVFTTDIDCIARYKAALGHERVYLLLFACQPKTHNPIELYPRKDAFCFAGAYYVRYPERTRDLENYVSEFPNFKPLEIFDRNFGKDDVNYQFPPEYQPYIVGTLPFNEIDKAYKGYRYSINLNSIKQSQTMFARRVYELLGSNTITVSNFSRGVRLLFGDLVVSSDSGKVIVDRLQRLSEEDSQKLRLAGMRKAMLEHSYEQRLAYVASKALGWAGVNALPAITVVALAKSKEECLQAIKSYRIQRHEPKRLILVVNGRDGDWLGATEDPTISVIYPAQADGVQLASILDRDDWIALMSPDDYYGPNYLLDLAIATRYSNAQVIGKAARFRSTDNEAELLDSEKAYRPGMQLSTRSSIIQAGLLREEESLLPWLEQHLSTAWEHPGLSVDAFNYCENGCLTNSEPTVKERVDDLNVDCGISIDSLLKAGETIPPSEFDESRLPKWTATKLTQLFGSVKSTTVNFESVLGGLTIQSSLLDGKHEYVYAPSELPFNTLPTSNQLETYLDATPGLDIQYVFVFLNDKKQKISHVIHTANRNHSDQMPEGTAFVRVGLRIYGSGATTIRALMWGHQKLEPERLIGRGDVLVLTNHYPSYDDLYRNGFVHSRVKSYQQRGVHVDVFRLRPQGVLTYHEYQNVDVITGGQEALRKLLDSGSYRSVLVHFLSSEMWDVLEHYPDLQCIVWVHGAEIQPWHRRDYNYQNEHERDEAVRLSERRMKFWRGILNLKNQNLKLVFVSRYFAEEVFEDLGFRLPEEMYVIIHNPIDTNLFAHHQKSAEQRKRVLSIRPYASRKYANDLSVRAILNLSKKPFFKDIEFRMIGDGKLFDETLEPLRQFANVTIQRGFLNHQQIAALHREYGICLSPTRMDAQGVSRDEAMSSGLVPVTNAVAAIPEFVDESCGILAVSEDADGLAEGIEMLYENPSRFLELSRQAAERVKNQSSAERIIGMELELFMPSIQAVRPG